MRMSPYPAHRWGVGLTALAFILTFWLADLVLTADSSRHRVMGLFYLSIPLVLFLTYLMAAVGQLRWPANPENAGSTPALERWGFPFFNWRAWGDFGRLYALLFLVSTGPALLVVLISSISSSVLPFEPEMVMVRYGHEPIGALSQGQLMELVLAGEIHPPAKTQMIAKTLSQINQGIFQLGSLFFLVCLTRLVPYFLWRGNRAQAATLAQTWAHVRWKTGLIFGLPLTIVLAGLMTLNLPIPITALGFTSFITAWLFLLAGHVGPSPTGIYDKG